MVPQAIHLVPSATVVLENTLPITNWASCPIFAPRDTVPGVLEFAYSANAPPQASRIVFVMFLDLTLLHIASPNGVVSNIPSVALSVYPSSTGHSTTTERSSFTYCVVADRALYHTGPALVTISQQPCCTSICRSGRGSGTPCGRYDGGQPRHGQRIIHR